jgi:hypothetical protein
MILCYIIGELVQLLFAQTMTRKTVRGSKGGRNPVAHFAHKANNRCIPFRDHSKYSRKQKHRADSRPDAEFDCQAALCA